MMSYISIPSCLFKKAFVINPYYFDMIKSQECFDINEMYHKADQSMTISALIIFFKYLNVYIMP